MDNENLKTIEHEINHAKTCFKNYKFAYLERSSKLHLLKGLKSNEPAPDLHNLLLESKNRLQKVKAEGKVHEKELLQLSSDIQRLSIRKEEADKRLADERDRNIKLKESLKSLESANERYDEYEKLVEKVEKNDGIIKAKMAEIDALKSDIKSLDIEGLEAKYAEAVERRNMLMKKQKRLSLIEYESHIEDLWYMYKRLIAFTTKVFNVKAGSPTVNGKTVLQVHIGKLIVSVDIENGKFVDASVKHIDGKPVRAPVDELVKYYKTINDPRLFVCYFIYNQYDL